MRQRYKLGGLQRKRSQTFAIATTLGNLFPKSGQKTLGLQSGSDVEAFEWDNVPEESYSEMQAPAEVRAELAAHPTETQIDSTQAQQQPSTPSITSRDPKQRAEERMLQLALLESAKVSAPVLSPVKNQRQLEPGAYFIYAI